MVEIEAEARKIGGSIGIIIPNDVVKKEGIKVHEKLRLELKRPHKIGDFFGAAKGWKRPTEEIIEELKKGWE
jgi:antitoxin component of MazEF toxin-antitoxin module